MFVILISLVIEQLLVNIWMFYAKVRAKAPFFEHVLTRLAHRESTVAPLPGCC